MVSSYIKYHQNKTCIVKVNLQIKTIFKMIYHTVIYCTLEYHDFTLQYPVASIFSVKKLLRIWTVILAYKTNKNYADKSTTYIIQQLCTYNVNRVVVFEKQKLCDFVIVIYKATCIYIYLKRRIR